MKWKYEPMKRLLENIELPNIQQMFLPFDDKQQLQQKQRILFQTFGVGHLYPLYSALLSKASFIQKKAIAVPFLTAQTHSTMNLWSCHNSLSMSYQFQQICPYPWLELPLTSYKSSHFFFSIIEVLLSPSKWGSLWSTRLHGENDQILQPAINITFYLGLLH